MRDDELNSDEAVKCAIALIEKEKVHFLAGSVSSAVQLAVNAVAKQRGIIYSWISQSDAMNEWPPTPANTPP